MDPILGKLTLETLMSHTPIAIAVSDAWGRLTMFSPALEELVGRPFRHLHEQHWVDIYDLYAADGVTRMRPEDVPLARAVRGEVVTDAVLATLRADGRRVYLRCNASPIRDANDTLVGAVVLVQDVTAERTAQETQEHLRDQLVETINHEIRTPLTKILGHAELLQEHHQNVPPSLRKSIDGVAAGAADLFGLADVISGLADLEARTRLTKAHGNLAGLLRAIVAEHQPKAEPRGISLVCRAPKRAAATLDATQTRKAVAALLENALTHAPTGSQVEVDLTVNDACLEITVRDQGPGIDPADWPRLTQPFERGLIEAASSSGRGLGLAVARTIAAAHGGELHLHSPLDRRDQAADGDGNGPGACITLHLPRHSGATNTLLSSE